MSDYYVQDNNLCVFYTFFHISSQEVFRDKYYLWFIDKEAETSFRLSGDMRWHGLKGAGKSGL